MKILVVFCLAIMMCRADIAGELDLPMGSEEVTADNKVVEFLKGMIEGLGVKEDIEKFMKCIKEAEQVFAKIKEALEHLKHININELKKGLELLFEALKELFAMLKPCAETGSIIHKLISAITNANIAKIALHILMHPVQFVKDVESTIVCFAKGDFHCAGKGIGDILRIMFLSRAQQ